MIVLKHLVYWVLTVLITLTTLLAIVHLDLVVNVANLKWTSVKFHPASMENVWIDCLNTSVYVIQDGMVSSPEKNIILVSILNFFLCVLKN